MMLGLVATLAAPKVTSNKIKKQLILLIHSICFALAIVGGASCCVN